MEITADIITQFRAKYFVFSDSTKYPDSIVELALGYADDQTNSEGWGGYENKPTSLKQNGMFAWAGNWLYNAYPDGAQDPNSMIPFSDYAVSSKSVGDESVSYAVDSPSIDDQFYFKTWWGQLFLSYKATAARAQGFLVL